MAAWVEDVDIRKVHDGELNYPAQRDLLVGILRGTDWYRRRPALRRLVEELEATDDEDSGNMAVHGIYDLADHDRVWLRGL